MHEPHETGSQPIRTLDYAPPEPSRKSRTAMFIAGGFFVAFGVGWLIFGILMANGMRDDYAGPIAIGGASVVFGVSLFLPFALKRS